LNTAHLILAERGYFQQSDLTYGFANTLKRMTEVTSA